MELPTFLYRCPNTGLRVQGWIANDPTEQDEDSFDAVTCPACGRVHLVNPQTGKVLGATDNGLAQDATPPSVCASLRARRPPATAGCCSRSRSDGSVWRIGGTRETDAALA